MFFWQIYCVIIAVFALKLNICMLPLIFWLLPQEDTQQCMEATV